MSSSSSDPAATLVELTIDVPHWLATVALLDNNLHPVALSSRVVQVPGEPFLGRLALAVAPGPYQVSVTIDGKTQSEWVFVEPGASNEMNATVWNKLKINTALPLPDAAPVTHPSDQIARIASIKHGLQRGPGESRVSLFATAVTPGTEGDARDFDFDLAILDGSGLEVVTLKDTSVRRYVAQHELWRCVLDLDPGPYTLRSRVPMPRDKTKARHRYRYQSLCLCPGMDHALFLRCDGPADLSTLTMHVTYRDQGYDPLRPEAIAADAVLNALANGQAQRLLLGSETLSQMLHGEIANPWLGVLAAYGLMAGPVDDAIQAQIDEIVAYLANGPLASHPDVRVLLINESTPPAPFEHPPMLLVAVRRLQRLATTRSGLIAPNSPLEAVCGKLVADTAWTAWIEDVETRSRPAADESGSSMPPPLRAFVEAFPDNAPVYPLQQVEPLPEDQAIAQNATLAGHAAIIEASRHVLDHSYSTGTGIGAVEVHFNEVGGSLLDLSAEEVSQLTGAPLDQVTRDLTLLGTTQASNADRGALERPMQLMAAAILGRQLNAAAREGEDASLVAPNPIETQARLLGENIARLRRLKTTMQADAVTRIEAVASVIEACVQRMIKRAHLLILADRKGRLRYGNKLFRDRLAARDEGAETVLFRMQQVFAEQDQDVMSINAARLSPTSPEGRAETMIEIQRARLLDGQKTIGHVYLLRDETFPPIDRMTARQVDEVLPLITLSSSMLQFAKPEEQPVYLSELESSAKRLSELLSIASTQLGAS